MRTVVAACCVLAACSVVHEPAEAGHADDAGIDAGHDVGNDAHVGNDAFVSIDAYEPPDVFDPPDGSAWDPTWVPIDRAPIDCHITIATHPERLSWPRGLVNAAYRIADRTYFDVSRASGSAADVVFHRGLVDATGRVAMALRTALDPLRGASCSIDDLAVYESDVAFHVTYCGADPSSCGLFGTWTSRLHRGRWADLATTDREIAHVEYFIGNDTPPSPIVALGAELTSIVDAASALHVVLGDGTVTTLGVTTARPVHLGDDVLFATGTPAMLARSTLGGPPAVLRDELGNAIRWVGTDGTTLAWTLGDETLYTGTYDGTLHGRLVRSGWSLAGFVGAGLLVRQQYVADTPSHWALTIVRFADGLRATVELPEYLPVLHVASDEILLGSRDADAMLASLPRIDPRTLAFR